MRTALIVALGTLATLALAVTASCYSFILSGAYAPDGLFGVYYYSSDWLVAVPIALGLALTLVGMTATFAVAERFAR